MSNQGVTIESTTHLPAPKAHGTRRSYRKHGLTPLLRGRSKALTPQLDARCTAMQAMKAYRADLLSSLGDADSLSQQELTIVEICCKDWLILQSVDAYLLQAGLFSKRKKSAHGLTLQRMQIADSLTRRLQSLGLARRAKPISNLASLLAGTNKETA